MGVRLDGIYRKFKKQPRPDWRNESSYPAEPDKWSHRMWAWEFLRRNPAYQKECNSVDIKAAWLTPFRAEKPMSAAMAGAMSRDIKRNTEIGRRFGRSDLKSFREVYGQEEDDQRLWLSETVTQVKPSRRSDGNAIHVELESGQVAIIFDLNRCFESGNAAKTSLLAHAKEILDRELEAHDAKLPEEQRTKIIRVRREKLFLWLRL